MEEEALAPLLREPETAGLFLDFDGTLSDIVHIPSEARPVEGVVGLLRRLSRKLGLVAIISGRAASQIVHWVGPEIEVWGIHGAEGTVGGSIVLSERAEPYKELMAAVLEEARSGVAELELPGVIVEDKGVMIGLHFRGAENPIAAREVLDGLAQELADRHGLIRAGGRLAHELRPPVEFSKGAVVLDRTREAGLQSVAFFGDDRVDLPGFDALDRLAEQGIATVKVAVDSDEAPPELIERADVTVDSPTAAVALLQQLDRA